MSSKPEDNDVPAPASQAGGAEDTNYPELARANLARLRGDYDLAERQCMALLKQTPHSPTVAALLGDVWAEQGRLDEAIQWYEMAIDSGAPSGIKEKLDAIRIRVKERDAASSEREIGLVQRTWASPPVLVGGAVIILMLLVCAYVAGTYRTPVKISPIPDQTPIVLPSVALNPATSEGAAKPDARPLEAPATPPVAGAPATTAPAPSPSKGAIDASLVPLFASVSGPLSRVTAASLDPRSHSVNVEVPANAGEDPRALAADVALAGMGVLKEATSMTIRVVKNGKPLFLADCTRERFDAFDQKNSSAGDASVLADALLSNEWRDASESASTGR